MGQQFHLVAGVEELLLSFIEFILKRLAAVGKSNELAFWTGFGLRISLGVSLEGLGCGDRYGGLNFGFDQLS